MATVTLTIAEYRARTGAFKPEDHVIIEDNNYRNFTVSEVASLAENNVDEMKGSYSWLQISYAQYKALGSVSINGNNIVYLEDNKQTLQTLSSNEIREMGAKGITALYHKDNGVLKINVSQAIALIDAHIGTGGSNLNTYVISDTGSNLANLTAFHIEQLVKNGFNAIESTDGALNLSVSQYRALSWDYGYDYIVELKLSASDAITLTDTDATLRSLTENEIKNLAAKGIDQLNATDNTVTLSLGQYLALGTITFAAEDVVKVNGTAAAEHMIGTVSNNVLKGYGGNDNLNGEAGNDVIYGGLNNDVLTGGLGLDVFVFDTKLGTHKTDRKVNFDTIKGFNVADDSLWLESFIFKAKGLKALAKGASEDSPKMLSKKFFTVGSKARDKDDYVIYDKNKGVLSYDVDGSGAKKAIEIAQLDKKLKMTYKDFFII